jgi:FixJ family two-component response regulator
MTTSRHWHCCNQDGPELIGLIRGVSPESPVIVISGGGPRGDHNMPIVAKHRGAQKVLAKPVSTGALLGAIDALPWE